MLGCAFSTYVVCHHVLVVVSEYVLGGLPTEACLASKSVAGCPTQMDVLKPHLLTKQTTPGVVCGGGRKEDVMGWAGQQQATKPEQQTV